MASSGSGPSFERAAPASKASAPAMPRAGSAAVTPPGRFAFAALIEGRMPERRESRRFEAQKWEPDLAKALDLPPGARLERRSAIYRVPEFKYPILRVDRIYRLDRNAAGGGTGGLPGSVPTAARGFAPVIGATSSTKIATSAAPTGTAALDAGGGELLWDNAMVGDHLIVQVQKGVTKAQLMRALPDSCRVGDTVVPDKGVYLVSVPAAGDISIERAVMALNHESLQKTIKFAEPDFLMGGADTTPDDPLFTTSPTDTTKQWHLPRIMAPRAWDVVKQPAQVGATPADTIANTTVVAVVDTGLDYTHPDLIPNLYVNPGESGGGKETNGQDDDGNGKIDDYRGWNFVENNNDPMDDVGHGTHVAGIIGSVGNNATGASGVCWGVKMMPLRIIKKLGLGTYGAYSDAVAAMSYMRTMNSPTQRIRVANHSWGGNGFSLAMLNALNNPLASLAPLPAGLNATYARDVNVLTLGGAPTDIAKVKIGMTACSTALPEHTRVTIISGNTITLSNYTTQSGTNAPIEFINPELPKQYGVVHVAAAGNSRFNLDRIPTYPASLPSGFVISVAASDVTDNPAVWSGTAGSNFGKLTADLFAPGSNIWSTRWKQPGDPGYGYESRNGTSMAAPQVAGAVALLRMWQPKMTDVQARQILIDQVEPISVLKDKCISGGRLNVARMVDKIYTPALLASGGSTGGSGTAAVPLTGASGTTGLVSAGTLVTLAVKEGKVLAWGSNYWRGLASSTLVESATPVIIPGLSDVVMVSTGYATCFAIKTDGTLWGWGDNSNGQIGIGNKIATITTPVQVTGITDVIWVSSSSYHAVAVKSDGTVWAWGRNVEGQLGDGTTTERLIPVQVTGLNHVLMAEAGSTHTIALQDDGDVYCWGKRASNVNYNPLGDGLLTGQSNVPVHIAGISDVSLVDAGNSTSLALKNDGTIWQWGTSGTAYLTPSSVPVQKPGLANIVLAAFHDSNGWAMDADGRIFGWGAGQQGHLGNGSFQNIFNHSGIINADDQPMVTLSGNLSTCYFRSVDGSLFAVGGNGTGNLGIGVSGTKFYAVPLSRMSGIVNVAFGMTTWNSGSANAGFAIDSSGQVFRWGDGDVGYTSTPRQTNFMAGATRIKISPYLCQFTKSDGTLWAWGSGSFGQLGNGSTSNSGTPAKVSLPVGSIVSDFAGSVTSIGSGGGGFAAAVLSDGALKMWGNNSNGQLGDGTTTQKNTPFSVPGMVTVAKVALGAAHTLALLTNGTVSAWGRNNKGQLGLGNTIDVGTPTPIPLLTDVVDIACAGWNSFAVKSDGTVWSWGEAGSFPGLGYSIVGDVKTPTKITSLSGVASISASGTAVLALKSNQTVWAWGQALTFVGRGPTGGYSLPAQVVGLSGVIEVTAGDPACYARKADGSLWAWGREIGDGLDKTSFPVKVVGFAGESDARSSMGTQNSAASWQFQNFSVTELLDDNIVSDDADPDGDGIGNLLEYALGLDPLVRDRSGLPTMRVEFIAPRAQSEGAGVSQIALFDASCCCGGGTTAELVAGKQYPVFTVNRQDGIRQDINYWVEVSEDLELWRSGDPYTITVLDTAETLEVYSSTPLDIAPRQFMRLRVGRK